MSMETGGKVVQTELDADEYERFRHLANTEGLTLKEALRRAVVEYTDRHGKHDPDDPFFRGAADGDGSGRPDRDLTATATEDYLYGEK